MPCIPCSVAVFGGLVGSIVLKLVEGLTEGPFRTTSREFEDEAPKLEDRFNDVLDRIRWEHHYTRHGDASLVGVNGICIICCR